MTDQLLSSFTPSTMSAELLECIFVKREPLADEILDSIATAALQPAGRRDLEHRLVVGPRGMGKTHLLTIVANRLDARHDLDGRIVVARLREEEWGVSTTAELLEQVVRQLASPDQPDREVRELAAAEVPAVAVASVDQLEDLATAAIHRCVGDRLVVIAVENLDELFAAMGTLEEHALRAFLQNERNFVLLASTPSLGASISTRQGLWFGFFHIEHLDELNVDEARDLLVRLVRLQADGGDPGLIELLESETGTDRLRVVQQIVGGHPRLWMLMADCITTQRLDEVVGLIHAVLDDLTPYYQSQMKLLSGQQRKIVMAMSGVPGAMTVGSIAAAARVDQRVAAKQLGDLVKLGYVRLATLPSGIEVKDKRQRHYELREPLLRHSLEHKESRGRPLSLIVDLLKAWFDQEQLEEWAEVSSERGAVYVNAALELVGNATNSTPVNSSGVVEALIHMLRAGGLAEQSRFVEALNEIDRAIALDASAPDLHRFRGSILFRLAMLEDAIQEYHLAIEMDPNVARFHDELGNVWSALGQVEQALAARERAIELDPGDDTARFNRANDLGRSGRLEEALGAYDELLNERGPDPDVLCNRGAALAALTRFPSALESFEAAITIEPGRSHFHSNRGLVLFHLGDFDSGRAAFRDAVRLDPSSPAGWLELVCLVDLADQQISESEITRVIAQSPDLDPTGLERLVRAVLRRQRGADMGETVRSITAAASAAGWWPELQAVLGSALGGLVNSGGVPASALTVWSNELNGCELSGPMASLLGAVAGYGRSHDGSELLTLPAEMRPLAYQLLQLEPLGPILSVRPRS